MEKPLNNLCSTFIKWFLCLAIVILVMFGFFDYRNRTVEYEVTPMYIFYTEGIE